MNKVDNTTNYSENNTQNNEQNRFQTCEDVVGALVSQGLPRAYNPSTFITKISKSYGINPKEARTCLKLAIKQLELNDSRKEKPETTAKLYAQSGYYYPEAKPESKDDEMASLSSFANYNRLMFGLK